MGFVLLGLYAWNNLALQGAVMQMVAHGVSTAALFMMAGALQQRLHTRDMRKMGGLWHQAPRMGACAMFFAVASLGLPGLGNFIAEFLVLAGLFSVAPWMATAAALGLITAAIYALWMMQQAFQGRPDETRSMADFGSREIFTMAAMMLALLWLGLYPQPVFDLVQPVVHRLDQRTVASGVFQQILLQIGIAHDHPHIAEYFQHHARRNPCISLYAQLIEHTPDILAEKTNHNLTVGKGGVVIRYFADTFGHRNNCQPAIRQSGSDGAGQYSGWPDGFQTAILPVFQTEMAAYL
jgi:NADH:ubiquinone oxidoreductase subunit 5 (subunit L)/multisubunit Na+/H+ antiporter MnhA subunit